MSNLSNTTGGAAGPASSTAPQAQPKARHAPWWVLGSFAFLVLAALLGIWYFAPALYTRLAGTETQGRGYRVADCGSDDDGDETYYQTMLFRDAQGQLQESTSGDDCSSDVANGDTVSLWYLPTMPGSIFMGGDGAIFFSVFAALYLASFLAGIGFFGYWAWVLLRASAQGAAIARLGFIALACLVMLVPLLVAMCVWPPPTGQQYNGPTRNYHVGETVPVADRWAITVEGKQLARISGSHAPDAAETACLELDITLRNTTRQTLAFEVNQFALFDAQAQMIDTSCSVDTPKLGSGQVAPGQVMQGALAYRVSATLRDFYLAFRPGAPQENVGRFFWHLQATLSSAPGSARPSVV